MYWCIQNLGDLVATTSYVPELEFAAPVTTTLVGGMTEVVQCTFLVPFFAARRRLILHSFFDTGDLEKLAPDTDCFVEKCRYSYYGDNINHGSATFEYDVWV
jgi:hypothetical protein